MEFKDYFSRGLGLMQERKIDEALKNFEAALKIQPNNADVLKMVENAKMLAVLLEKQAESLANEAMLRARVLGIRVADVDEAITEYTQTLKSNPNDISTKGLLASAYYLRGLTFQSKKEYVQALEDYSRAINNSPDHRLAYNKRGTVNLEIGKIENCTQAIEDFKKANLDEDKLKEKLAGAYWKRAIAYYQKGDNADAVKDCEWLLELNPNDASARELLNMAKTQM